MLKQSFLFSLFLVIVFSFLFVPKNVNASITNIYCDNDANVFSANPDTNYGSENFVSVGYNSGFRYGLINWNLTELIEAYENPLVSKEYIYVNVSVKLTQGGGGNLGMLLKIYRIETDWNESTVTYNTKPTLNQAVIDSVYLDYYSYYNAYYYALFDVTDILDYYLAIGGTNFYGFWFYGSNGTQVTHIDSKEDSVLDSAKILFSSIALDGEAEEEGEGEVLGVTSVQFSDIMFNMIFLLVPSFILAMELREIAGIAFCGGLMLMTSLGFMVGIYPLWIVMVMFIVSAMILFALFKKGLIGI